mmetsp:Transcript_65085/g.167525  ORF Transcript_65085/g.167525 Transcript_65085/m.167525 type:complete len:200 (-) Transcript_65085:2078-2677(-)
MRRHHRRGRHVTRRALASRLLALRRRRHGRRYLDGLEEARRVPRPHRGANRLQRILVLGQRLEGLQLRTDHTLGHDLAQTLSLHSLLRRPKPVHVVPLFADLPRLHDVDDVAQPLGKQHVRAHLPEPLVRTVDEERVDACFHRKPHTRLILARRRLEPEAFISVHERVANVLAEEVVLAAHMREPRRLVLVGGDVGVVE